MSKARKAAAMEAMTALDGVGPATAEKMVSAGMETHADVVAKGVEGLSKAGVGAAAANKALAAATASVEVAVASLAALTSLDGIGKATAERMMAAGIDGLDAVVAAGLEGLAEAGVGPTAAKKALAGAEKAVAKAAMIAKGPPEAKRPATAVEHKPKSVISTVEAGVRGDQVGTKIEAPKGVADMLRRIRGE